VRNLPEDDLRCYSGLEAVLIPTSSESNKPGFARQNPRTYTAILRSRF
jgi:hypothetical protein